MTDDYWERWLAQNAYNYTCDDLKKASTYSNAATMPKYPPTLPEILRAMDEVKTKVATDALNPCGACGEWRKCICPASIYLRITVRCYLCDAQHDPRVEAPRVCQRCKERYLP